MSEIYFEMTDGSLEIGITVTETSEGLKFDITVLDDTGVIGDLNGLFFDLADDSILSDLSVEGLDLTGDVMKADGVTKVDGYNNVNGEVAKDAGKFDIGVQFGTQGIGEDDIQSTSFLLSTSSDTPLTIDDIMNQDFAVRLTSVGDADGDRDGSVKIGGTAEPEVVEPPVSVNVAVDDSMTVSNEETFNDFGFGDPLDNFQFALVDNDTTEDGPYTGDVTGVNGEGLMPGTVYEGSNGGLLMVDANGVVDFSANNQFDFLSGDQTANTQFEYTIEGGSTAVLDVLVFAAGGDGGGGGDFFL